MTSAKPLRAAGWLAAAAIALCSSTGWAGPRLLAFQGRLVDATGSPRTGNFSITFSFYDSLTNGNVCFSETQTLPVSSGLFAASIGSASGGIAAACTFNAQSYLQIQVAGDTPMTPRITMSAMPYAFNTDAVSNYTAGNGSGQIPLANGVVNANLNAAMVNGQSPPFQNQATLHTFTCQWNFGSLCDTTNCQVSLACPAGQFATQCMNSGGGMCAGGSAWFSGDTCYVQYDNGCSSSAAAPQVMCCKINNP
ncbi:MAG TPA: hypothetical protein VFF06_26025 [Polyangia bacterium]|nr:hypothetical protein [Polyangia bacterium]